MADRLLSDSLLSTTETRDIDRRSACYLSRARDRFRIIDIGIFGGIIGVNVLLFVIGPMTREHIILSYSDPMIVGELFSYYYHTDPGYLLSNLTVFAAVAGVG